MMTEPPAPPWQRLQGKVAHEVFTAPKTCGDPNNSGQWQEVPAQVVNYLARHVVNRPWGNPLALLAAVWIAQRYDRSTVFKEISLLHVRLSRLFAALQLVTFNDWDAERHIPAYLRKEVLPDESAHTRHKFWLSYGSAARQQKRWQDSLPQNDRSIYTPFVFPLANSRPAEGWMLGKQVHEQQRLARKKETDAIVPRLAELRAEAHLRYNRLLRLHRAYLDALRTLTENAASPPISFCYEEGQEPEKGVPFRERLSFRIWDRRSFVLAHAERYGRNTVRCARRGLDRFTEGKTVPFLEFVKAESLVPDTPPEGLWFLDLLERGVLGLNPTLQSPSKLDAKREWLRSRGYPDTAFRAGRSSLLSWPKADSTFMHAAQRRTPGPLESFCAAATFGLLLTDLFTTTGARINEVMQIRLTKDCIVQLMLPAPPDARMQSSRVRYVLRLIPKGERTDRPQDYFIGEETKRLLVKVAQMLGEHYGLKPGEALPTVEYDPNHCRSHRFHKAPFLFQYHHRHLGSIAIPACMRFLFHGMVFKTRDGQRVVLKPHLLRHAFATHAVQVERIPKDIVGAWLHQKIPK